MNEGISLTLSANVFLFPSFLVFILLVLFLSFLKIAHLDAEFYANHCFPSAL